MKVEMGFFASFAVKKKKNFFLGKKKSNRRRETKKKKKKKRENDLFLKGRRMLKESRGRYDVLHTYLVASRQSSFLCFSIHWFRINDIDQI